ncbi:MAG: DEAD/DEAH box helicase family protein [Actinomycetota bacterium]|nr:DEAD/DEAH box helicase family protein [Actinomycetota bacterium]
MDAADLSNPILNSPFDPPERHFELGEKGPTGVVLPGRRPSESFIPVPASRKGKISDQEAFDFDLTGERREQNTLINDIRREVELWRANNWNGVTGYTRKLLMHWAATPPDRDDPVLFCQREAAETAIFLAETAGRYGTADYRRRLDPENLVHNDGLPRVGLKMATGTGKTVVMAMLIAWQTINKVTAPRDARFAKRFLVVAPGVTIKDRLGVLHPEREDNYYRERDLVPPELWDALLQAQIEVVNYHAFLPRDATEIKGVASNTRKLLRGDKPGAADAFRETPELVAARILRSFGSGKGAIVVLNDEAHHCYQDKLAEHPDDDAEREDEERNREARVWFRGLSDLRRKAGIKTVYDLSATPYYLKGSGYNEGFIFPWVVSDFSLMDAIESGIVKVPRVPVDDDAAGREVVYLNLWDNIQPPLPRRKVKDLDAGPQGWVLPETLEGALRSLYRSYETNHARYERELAAKGEPPPVLIVVCPNTVVSKLVFEWIGGRDVERADGTIQNAAGNLPLLSNVSDGQWATQRTILVDSVQLESGEPLGADFRKDAAHEIEAFKHSYRLRNPGADVDKLTDADLLREAMNTIGKKGKLGEQIRCVVSVAMLTEGWDANTVTHILGIRPFRSQLLCEQVVGRGLRRRSYVVNEDGRFDPEYAEIYGVPFAFIPSDRPVKPPKPPRPAIEVRALPERWELAIRFPKLDGYRVELPDEPLHADFDEDSALHLDHNEVALWVKSGGVVGVAQEVDLDDIRDARPQRIAFLLAKVLLERDEFFAALAGDERPWLFPQLVAICRGWLDECVTTDDGVTKGHLLLTQACARAAEKLFNSIVRHPGSRAPVLMPIIRRFDREGSTDEVRYLTRKVVMDPPPTKSHLNHVVLDGLRGNSWEEGLAQLLEADDGVAAYVKNERLDFTIPYIHEGRTHQYVPDFLVRLAPAADDIERTLIIEVSGSQKSPGPTIAKATTARDQWCAAINNWGEFGQWGYIEVGKPADAAARVSNAIDRLYNSDRELLGIAT